jgi:hypothetical protein
MRLRTLLWKQTKTNGDFLAGKRGSLHKLFVFLRKTPEFFRRKLVKIAEKVT